MEAAHTHGGRQLPIAPRVYLLLQDAVCQRLATDLNASKPSSKGAQTRAHRTPLTTAKRSHKRAGCACGELCGRCVSRLLVLSMREYTLCRGEEHMPVPRLGSSRDDTNPAPLLTAHP
jgi:hypothetical protein